MNYQRMIMEVEAPEQIGYDLVRYNLAESSMSDRVLGELDLDLSGVVLCYGDHRGHAGLRELIAADGPANLTADDVLLCAGAAGALFTVATALLRAGDHVVVAHPNYASNFETPKAIGADVSYLELQFDQGWMVDLQRLSSLIRPETKLVSLTTPHNPTGTEISPSVLDQVIEIVEATNAYLLLDETYRELSSVIGPPWAVKSARVISVSSLSKTYGMPGIRLGWLICRDGELMETFLAGKEQIALGGSVVDEEIAFQVLQRRLPLLERARAHAASGFGIVKAWIESEPYLEWVEPTAGVVCFPRLIADAGVNPLQFHKILNSSYATYVGPGHWFEQDSRYMRIGFGFPALYDLEIGLDNISKALRESIEETVRHQSGRLND